MYRATLAINPSIQSPLPRHLRRMMDCPGGRYPVGQLPECSDYGVGGVRFCGFAYSNGVTETSRQQMPKVISHFLLVHRLG